MFNTSLNKQYLLMAFKKRDYNTSNKKKKDDYMMNNNKILAGCYLFSLLFFFYKLLIRNLIKIYVCFSFVTLNNEKE